MLEARLSYSRRNLENRRRESRITIPSNVGPHVRLVFAELQRQRVRYDEVEEKAGVLRSTLKAWRHKNAPGLTSLEAVLGFLGWSFIPVPRERALPPEIIAELRPIADRLGLTMQPTIEALFTIAAGIPHRAGSARAA